jgi:2-polyprenyl-3-methyl-5-hydroxy-6-metoxy-1,4-benzoquinol methylase
LAYTNKNANIIDVGSGVSILADNLLDEGYTHLSLLELSPTAIQTTQERLKSYSNRVNFYNENILDFQSNTQFDLWHDRAVFHFLTNEKDQQTYLNKLNQYLKPQGYFLLATFAPTGPKQCSDLNIVQYDTDKIVPLLGNNFTLIKTTSETHPHPNGSTQDFNYFLFQKL